MFSKFPSLIFSFSVNSGYVNFSIFSNVKSIKIKQFSFFQFWYNTCITFTYSPQIWKTSLLIGTFLFLFSFNSVNVHFWYILYTKIRFRPESNFCVQNILKMYVRWIKTEPKYFSFRFERMSYLKINGWTTKIKVASI